MSVSLYDLMTDVPNFFIFLFKHKTTLSSRLANIYNVIELTMVLVLNFGLTMPMAYMTNLSSC